MSEHSFSVEGAKYHKDDFNWDCKAKVPLKVIIVGAGIAGLTAGIGTVEDIPLVRRSSC